MGKKCMNESWLVLILLLIGWESCIRSQSVCYAKTKANAQIKLDAQVKSTITVI